jgi:hypothetical protein
VSASWRRTAWRLLACTGALACSLTALGAQSGCDEDRERLLPLLESSQRLFDSSTVVGDTSLPMRMARRTGSAIDNLDAMPHCFERGVGRQFQRLARNLEAVRAVWEIRGATSPSLARVDSGFGRGMQYINTWISERVDTAILRIERVVYGDLMLRLQQDQAAIIADLRAELEQPVVGVYLVSNGGLGVEAGLWGRPFFERRGSAFAIGASVSGEDATRVDAASILLGARFDALTLLAGPEFLRDERRKTAASVLFIPNFRLPVKPGITYSTRRGLGVLMTLTKDREFATGRR